MSHAFFDNLSRRASFAALPIAAMSAIAVSSEVEAKKSKTNKKAKKTCKRQVQTCIYVAEVAICGSDPECLAKAEECCAPAAKCDTRGPNVSDLHVRRTWRVSVKMAGSLL